MHAAGEGLTAAAELEENVAKGAVNVGKDMAGGAVDVAKGAAGMAKKAWDKLGW